ncbi:MAG: phosphoribosylformylglycinamidine synthase I [Bacteriovoracaceae bacterium]|nr:phosphoribosylformylglycinamidine synthase I [Bacteriovoracaceae bacterium]
MKTKVLIITGDGVNCEQETSRAFKLAGADTEILHINQLVDRPKLLEGYQILALPGGFSFGDELGSGKIFSLKLKEYIGSQIQEFIKRGNPIIGICNGFQVLTKLGIFGDFGLAQNESGKFIDKWVHLKVEAGPCIWLKGITSMKLPIRHGEGRFIVNKNNSSDLEKLKSHKRVVLRYQKNPNGSVDDIAGVCDESGLVFGLMPHPEAAVKELLYPGGVIEGSVGLSIFKNAVNYCQKREV